jgi:acyl carrier protein
MNKSRKRRVGRTIMNKEILDRFYKVLMGVQNLKVSVDEITPESKLNMLGFNSILFIKLILAIESEFDFEFEDEDLDYSRFKDIGSLLEFIEKKSQPK